MKYLVITPDYVLDNVKGTQETCKNYIKFSKFYGGGLQKEQGRIS